MKIEVLEIFRLFEAKKIRSKIPFGHLVTRIFYIGGLNKLLVEFLAHSVFGEESLDVIRVKFANLELVLL